MEHIWGAIRHLVLNMLICRSLKRHSSGDARLAVGYTGLELKRAVQARWIKLKVGIQMMFKAMRLDEITKSDFPIISSGSVIRRILDLLNLPTMSLYPCFRIFSSSSLYAKIPGNFFRSNIQVILSLSLFLVCRLNF